VIGLLLAVLTDAADEDPVTGREVYPAWVFHVFAGAVLLAVLGVLAST
jgi:hypothetical protein